MAGKVTFKYGANGRLTVQALVPGTGQNTTLDLERAVNRSREEAAQAKSPGARAAERTPAASRSRGEVARPKPSRASDEFNSMVHDALEGLSSEDLKELMMGSAEESPWANNVDADASAPPREQDDSFVSAPRPPAERGTEKRE